jgi:trimeric autotransporter adhesin
MITPKLTSLSRALFVLAAFCYSSAFGQTISGHLVVCRGASRTTLSISTSGGAWSSGDVTKATIDASTGEVTGIAAGTAEITYTVPPSTYYTAVVTVNSFVMSSIGFSTGSGSLCTGGAHATCTVTPTFGNAWSSSDPSVVTVNTGGLLTSTSTAGTSVITYHHGIGNCNVSREVTVNPLPTVSVMTPMCNTTTQTVTGTPAGGTWSSSNTGVGTIDATTGELTARAGGSTYIYYTLPSGCRVITLVSVTNVAAALTGSLVFCAGSSSTLTSSPAGGTWSSSDGGVATIGSSTGLVTGISAGTSTISYTNGAGCSRTAIATVNAALAAIAGPTNVCVGQSITLTNASGGGTWSSSSTSKATVNSATGLVTGISTGTAFISYKIGSSCYTVSLITVDVAAAITGTTSLCLGSTTTLSHPVSGGTWSSSNTARATIGSASGVVTGVTIGTAIMTYTLGAGCYKTVTIVVNNNPAAITGIAAMCTGASSTLACSTSGGTWSSENTAIASVGATTGGVTGVSGGTVVISFTVTSTGCAATRVVTVNTGGTISGTLSLCTGSTTGLSSSSSGGTWSSSNTSVATVGSGTGLVLGVSAGTATITYSVSGCRTTVVVTTNTTPAAIVGTTTITAGGTATLSNTTSGGVWTSDNTSVATIGSTSGILTGIASGVAVITYATSSVCFSTVTVTVTESGGCGDGYIITTIAGTGAAGYSGDGGQATSAELNLPHGIDIDAAGNIFFADHDNNRIRKIDLSGVITTVAGTGTAGFSGDGGQATAAKIYHPYDVTVDAAGNVYFGDGLNHRIRKISTTGIISTVAGNGMSGYSGDGGAASAAMINHPAGVAFDLAGNIYFADSYNHRVRKIDIATGVITTTGGVGTSGYGGDGGPATAASFSYPNFMYGDPVTGDIYVTDNGNHCVRKISPAGIVTNVAGTGVHGATGDGGPATAAKLDYPAGVTKDADGNIYIADYINDKVRRIDVSGIISTYAGTGTAGYSGDGGPASAAKLNQMTDVSIDNAGRLCIVDRFNSRIRRVNVALTISGLLSILEGATTTLTGSVAGGTWSSASTGVATIGSTSGILTGIAAGTASISYQLSSGCTAAVVVSVTAAPSGLITTLAGDGTAGYAGDGGPVNLSRVSSVNYVIVDPIGNIYFDDAFNVRIRKISTSGIITTVAGNGTTGSSGDGGQATAAQLNDPSGIALDASGNLYIAENGGCRIRKVNTAGVISTYAGTGSASSSGDGGLATAAAINRPHGVVMDASGNMYISEQYAHKVRKINTSGIISTIAGLGTIGYTGDGGAATAAKLSYPNCIHVDPAGNVYVTDNGNHCLRMINTSGVISTIAGNGTPGFSGDGGQATAAKLRFPAGVKTDASGNVIIVDHANHRVRKIDPSGIITTIAGTGIGGYNGDCIDPVTAKLNLPHDICFDNSGDLLVVDLAGERIRKITNTVSVAGPLSVCIGSASTLAGTATGGTWTSSNIAVAIIGSVSGVVTGISAGTTSISYVTGTSCSAAAVVTVTSAAAAITGTTFVGVGGTTTLSDATSGGEWSSSNAAVASIGSATGVVTGVSTGTATISYVISGTGCYATTVVTVITSCSIIGSAGVCVSGTSTLSSPVSGGTWVSSNTSVATIGSSSGIVNGLSVGTSTITYDAGSCISTIVVTVNGALGGISGTAVTCSGGTTTLSHGIGGGVWTSGNTAVATVGSTSGIVTGLSAGTSLITYTAGGCMVTLEVTVVAGPGTISGSSTVCPGATTTLTSSVSGGTWSSSNTARATIGSLTGEVTGIASGTVRITYRFSASCVTTLLMTVSTLGSITGTAACLGATSTLSCMPSGGTWISSEPSVISIGSTSGIATALTTGTSTISYSATAGCVRTRIVTIDAVPAAITGGSDTICTGTSVTLATATSGGIWLSTNTVVATVGSASGTVAALTSGTTSIRYTMPGGCYVEKLVAVAQAPDSAYFIGGQYSVLENWDYGLGLFSGTTNITGLTGTWSSSNTAIATVTVVSPGWINGHGVSAGTAVISFDVSNACGSHTYTRSLVVTPQVCDDVWGTVGGGASAAYDQSAYAVTGTMMTIGTSGVPMASFQNAVAFYPYAGAAKVVRFDGTRFVNLVHPDLYFPALYGSDNDFTFTATDTSGVPYYGDRSTGYEPYIHIRKWNGIDWDLYTGHYAGVGPSVYLARDNRLYIAYSDPYSSDKSTVVRSNGSSWDTLGSPGFSTYTSYAHNITLDISGTPYVSFASPYPDDTYGTVDSVVVMKYNGSGWEQVGEKLLNTYGCCGIHNTSIKTDASGKPTVVYDLQGTGVANLFAASYNGTSWVGLGGSSVSSGFSEYFDLAIDPSGIPYISYKDYDNGQKTTVKKYSGSWTNVGAPGFTEVINDVSIAIDNAGTPYVSTAEGYNGNIWKLNGSNWVKMNGAPAVGDAAYEPVAMHMDVDTPYVTYLDNYKTTVKKLVGSSWLSVGAEQFSSANPNSVSMAAKGGIVYVAYVDASASYKATVMKYNGTSWSALGGTGISAGTASFIDIAVDNSGSPYLVYRDAANGNKATVLKHNGSSWVPVGSAGFTASAATGTSIAINSSGTPYVSFGDATSGGLSSVMKYNGSTWEAVGTAGFGFPASIFGSGPATTTVIENTWIEIDGAGVPYVAGFGGGDIFVRKFNGTSWVSLSPGPDYQTPASGAVSTSNSVSFAVSGGGTPYLTYQSLYPSFSESGKFHIVTFNGYDWVTAGELAYGRQDMPGISWYGEAEYYAGYSKVVTNAAGVPFLAQAYNSLEPPGGDYNDDRMQVKKLGANFIGGNLSICQGTRSFLEVERKSYLLGSGMWAYGVWSSSNTSVATVDTTGAVTGIAPGTATISYIYSGCPTTVVVTVSALPSAGTLSGSTSVAIGSSITLSSTLSGGIWSSSNLSLATVGSTSGSVTGVGAGSVTITYANISACGLAVATRTVNVTSSRPGAPAGDDATSGAEMLIYPNPTSGMLNVATGVNGLLAIYTIDGRELKQYEVSKGITNITLPNNLATGVYMIRFKGDDGSTKMLRLVFEK